MEARRHHNNKGLQQIKRGKTREFAKRLVEKLNTEKQSLLRQKFHIQCLALPIEKVLSDCSAALESLNTVSGFFFSKNTKLFYIGEDVLIGNDGWKYQNLILNYAGFEHDIDSATGIRHSRYGPDVLGRLPLLKFKYSEQKNEWEMSDDLNIKKDENAYWKIYDFVFGILNNQDVIKAHPGNQLAK